MKALKLLICIIAGISTILAVLLTAVIRLFSILIRIITGLSHKIR